MIIEKPAAVAAVAAAGDNRPQHTTRGTGRAVVDLAERIAGRIAALRTVPAQVENPAVQKRRF